METPPRSRPPKLRVGIMVNSKMVAHWVATIVKQIEDSSFAEIVLVVKNSGGSGSAKKSLRQRLKTYWTHGLFDYYKRWDRNRNKQEHDAFAEIDLTPLLPKIPILPVKPLQKGFTDRFAPEDISAIRDANLDVLFRFGFGIIRGEILSGAKYGVWSFHHADNREYRGAPPGFWELYQQNPVIGSILQILTESLDGGHVIYRSFSATNRQSLYLTLNAHYWKTAEFALRRLSDLYTRGWEYIQSLDGYNEPNTYKKGIYKTPRTPVMVRFLAGLALRTVYQHFRSVFFGQRTKWFIAQRSRTGQRTVLQGQDDFRVVPSARGRFYADPFLFKHRGETYIFFEDFNFDKNWASISYLKINGDSSLDRPEPCLDLGCHVSYPFLLEVEGDIFMIPETRSRKTIELYRAAEFPKKWELFRVIAKDIQAVDSTIFRHRGRFWLFTNIAVPAASTFDELHLFWSDTIDGDWTPHPKNPIVSDVRRARPAGALFFEGDRLLRPSQDCSVRYGYALNFNEVLVLSESDYKEIPLFRIEPDWYPGNVCTHSYSRTDEFEVLDGMKLVH